MWLKSVNLLSIFQIYHLIGQSFSAIFLSFRENSVGLTENYNRLKNSNVHRGVFFALSDDQIHKMCEDFYSSQLYVNSVEERRGEWKYRVMVQEIVVNGLRSFFEWELVVMCVTKRFENRALALRHHYITSAFRSKWLYLTESPDTDPTRHELFLMNFVALSPDHVDFNQFELETWYSNTLRTIDTLSKESPRYMKQIKERDSLSRLSSKQKLLLCASILSSPIYRQDNLEYSLRWIEETIEIEGAVDFFGKSVSFKSIENTGVRLKAECFVCKAFKDGTDMKSKSTDLYVSRTYENGYSAMVLREQTDGTIYPDKYFKNIAILITAKEEMFYQNLFFNFQKPKELNGN